MFSLHLGSESCTVLQVSVTNVHPLQSSILPSAMSGVELTLAEGPRVITADVQVVCCRCVQYMCMLHGYNDVGFM